MVAASRCCPPSWTCSGSRTTCSPGSTWRPWGAPPPGASLQAGFALACLPYEAYFSLDAIVRTTLENAGHAPAAPRVEPLGRRGPRRPRRPRGSRRRRAGPWGSPPSSRPPRRPGWRSRRRRPWLRPDPCCVLWFLSPVVAWLISLPLARRRAAAEPGPDGVSPPALPQGPGPSSRRSSAPRTTGCRRTTTRSTPAPPSRTARRRRTWGSRCWRTWPPTTSATSPRGSSSSARRRPSPRMERLERHQGHFYNWYDTRSLQPLPPRYVSTVDSGNLAGHLLTLQQGLLALPDQAIPGPRVFDGLRDTLRVLLEAAAGVRRRGRRLHRARLTWRRSWMPPARRRPAAPGAARLRLEQLSGARGGGARRDRPRGPRPGERRPAWWARALAGQCRRGARRAGAARPAGPPDGDAAADAARAAHAGAARPPPSWIAAIERLALQCGELSRMQYDFLFDQAEPAARHRVQRRRATGATRATTTCWLRKRGSAASWRSPRGSCRRRAGSPSGAC